MEELTQEQIQAALKSMSRDELITLKGMSTDQRRSFIAGRVSPEFIPEAIPTTAGQMVDAVNRGEIEMFKLPFTEQAAGFKPRLLTSFTDNPDKKIDILKKNGIQARQLPNGMVVILNNDNTVSALEERGLSAGDAADLVGSVAPTLGGLVGGSVGTAGGPAGIAGGVGLGTMAGQSINETVSSLLGGQSNVGEFASNVGTQGALASLFAGAVGGAGKLLSSSSSRPIFNPIIAPFKNRIDKLGVKSRPLFQAEGADLPVTALTHSRLVSMSRTAAARSLGGAERLSAEERAAIEALDKIVQRFSINTAPPLKAQDTGAFAQDAVALARRAFQGKATDRFEEIGRSIGDELVHPQSAFEYLTQTLKNQGLLSEVEKFLPARSIVPAAIKRLVPLWKDLKDGKFNYNTLKLLRTQVRTATPGPNEPFSTGSQSIYKGLEGRLTDDILSNAERIGLQRDDQGLVKRIIETNQWYKRNIELFNGRTGKLLENNVPERISPLLFRPGNVTMVQEAREILPRPYFDFLTRQWLDDVVQKSLNAEGELLPGRFGTVLQKQGDDSLKLMFGDRFDELVGIREGTMALGAGLRRGNLNTSETAGTLMMLRAFTHPIESAASILPGAGVSRLMTSDFGKKLLTEGTEVPLGNLLNKIGVGTQKAAQGAGFLSEFFRQGNVAAPADRTRR